MKNHPNRTTAQPATKASLLQSIEQFECLLFEPANQQQFDDLNALYANWYETLGDSPAAIRLCNALDDFIDACVEYDGCSSAQIDKTYLELINTIEHSEVFD